MDTQLKQIPFNKQLEKVFLFSDLDFCMRKKEYKLKKKYNLPIFLSCIFSYASSILTYSIDFELINQSNNESVSVVKSISQLINCFGTILSWLCVDVLGILTTWSLIFGVNMLSEFILLIGYHLNSSQT